MKETASVVFVDCFARVRPRTTSRIPVLASQLVAWTIDDHDRPTPELTPLGHSGQRSSCAVVRDCGCCDPPVVRMARNCSEPTADYRCA